MKWIKKLQPLPAILLLMLCVSVLNISRVSAAVQQDKAAVKAAATIQSIQVVGDGETAALLITTSAPVTYTSYKVKAPARLVIDFSQTAPADRLSDKIAGKGAFKSATVKRYDTEAGVLTRMELELVQDVDALIAPVPDKSNALQITFPAFKAVAANGANGGAAVAATQEPAAEPLKQEVSAQPAANTGPAFVNGVVAQGGAIQIQVTGEVHNYKTFRLTKPERVVVDILGAKASPELKIVPLNAAGIATARVGSYADKVRVVLDASNGGLADATLTKNADGILVAFATNGLPAPEQKNVQPAVAKSGKAASVASAAASRAQIDAIDFQVLEGLSRVSVKVKGAFDVEQPVKSAGFVSFKVLHAQLPKHLQRSYEAREFKSPVLRITPIQVRTTKGEDTVIRVATRADADYTLRKEADMLYLEFKHPAVPAPEVVAASAKAAHAAKASEAEASVEQQLAQPAPVAGKRVYTGRKVTLEFADAEVRKIFQLLSEVSNKNFVLGDEVTGAITMKLVNVPWDQALDIILDTKGLDKREDGNIILIRGKGKFKSANEDEVDLRKSQLKNEPTRTEFFDINYAKIEDVQKQFEDIKKMYGDVGFISADKRTNKIIVRTNETAINEMKAIHKKIDIPEKQVMIEARIIEASTSFVKSLGIHWGVNSSSQENKWPFIQGMETSFGGLTNTAPTTNGLFTVVPGAFSDIAFGTIGANVKLSMRLNAAASAGLVKIISTPKVATLNHTQAKITQGQQIPYTTATSDKIETKFVEAALSLEVTPHINANGTIVMEIDAKNDAPDRTTSTGTPPINKKEAKTQMLLRDGETTVIGGIYVDRDTENADGVPWLMDIPFLGHLFKSTNTEKTKSELLIFITPRILTMS